MQSPTKMTTRKERRQGSWFPWISNYAWLAAGAVGLAGEMTLAYIMIHPVYFCIHSTRGLSSLYSEKVASKHFVLDG